MDPINGQVVHEWTCQIKQPSQSPEEDY